MKRIATIHTGFKEKFGLPRQSGMLEELKGTIVFEKEYRIREAFEGLEDFSHIWVLWEFSLSQGKWSPMVRPPKLGGNVRKGVFATRSPFRPNPIGLSCLKLEKIEYTEKFGPVLIVSGIDMVDDTPILDIKPYIPYADIREEATSGFVNNTENKIHDVVINENSINIYNIEEKEKKELLSEIKGILLLDPRPGYSEEGDKEYKFEYRGYRIIFKVVDGKIYVISIENEK